ncbi:PilZ domain protein [Gemmata sp. SH-PL17]|nr:PilZ domain protein [Gemmata sp. SH-PL17]
MLYSLHARHSVETYCVSVQNRRGSVRFVPATSTSCYTESGGEGVLWDISATGLSMLVDTPPLLGVTLTVEVTSSWRVLTVKAQVAHVKQVAAGDYFVGMEFASPLALEEIEPFITPTTV